MLIPLQSLRTYNTIFFKLFNLLDNIDNCRLTNVTLGIIGQYLKTSHLPKDKHSCFNCNLSSGVNQFGTSFKEAFVVVAKIAYPKFLITCKIREYIFSIILRWNYLATLRLKINLI
jgi:hypothetical protein